MNAPAAVQLTGNDLTFAQLYDVALHGAKVSLAPDAIERMKASRAIVDRVVSSGETAYGINTGFGKLASVRISAEQVRQLQINLVRSHVCGVGTPLSVPETRAMMILRVNALASPGPSVTSASQGRRGPAGMTPASRNRNLTN